MEITVPNYFQYLTIHTLDRIIAHSVYLFVHSKVNIILFKVQTNEMDCPTKLPNPWVWAVHLSHHFCQNLVGSYPSSPLPHLVHAVNLWFSLYAYCIISHKYMAKILVPPPLFLLLNFLDNYLYFLWWFCILLHCCTLPANNITCTTMKF